MLHVYIPQLNEMILDDGRVVKIPSQIVPDDECSVSILNRIVFWATEIDLISENDEIAFFN